MTFMSDKIKDIISIVIGLLSLFIPFYFFFITSREDIQGITIIIFVAISIVLVVFIGSYSVVWKWRLMGGDVQKNKKEIFELRKDLNLKNLFNEMDVRVKVLEELFLKKNKRGNVPVDPRFIFWILMAILLYLFLKSVGVFP